MRGIISGEMKNLRKIKKDIDKGFPAFGRLLDDVIEEIPKKTSIIMNSAGKGFEKVISPPFSKSD